MGHLQERLCPLLEEGVGLHHTSEDQIHQCKLVAYLLACLGYKSWDLDFCMLLQTWKMLRNLIGFKDVVNFMYGTMRETSHLRDRCPQPTSWAIAEVLGLPLQGGHQGTRPRAMVFV
jgi:hypothetical protein